MKKITFMFVAVLALTFVACKDKNQAKEDLVAPIIENAEEIVEPEVEATDTMTVSQVLAEYETTVKKLIPALISMQKGDTKAIKEYQTLSKEVTKLAPILQKKAGEMSEKETKRYTEIADKLYKATNPNAPQTDNKKK